MDYVKPIQVKACTTNKGILQSLTLQVGRVGQNGKIKNKKWMSQFGLKGLEDDDKYICENYSLLP